jgi:2-haloacid dehalogenase
MSIEAVVFDIGNVLIEWNPERFYDARIGAERRRALLSEVPLHAVNLEIDRGAHLSQEIEALAQAHPHWFDEICLWRDSWLEMAQPAIEPSVKIMRALRSKGVPVFALSNFGVQTFAIAEAEYPFLSEFDRRFISGHMRVIKPDAKIYEAVETETNIPPSALLFTDDRAENIAAASARGWDTHLFDGASGLAQCLVAKGLLSEEEAT